MFTHLHVHSQYSVLDGQASIDALVDKAMADGMPGMALTDHGNMFGIKEYFNYAAKKNGKTKGGKNVTKTKSSAKRFSNRSSDVRCMWQEIPLWTAPTSPTRGATLSCWRKTAPATITW